MKSMDPNDWGTERDSYSAKADPERAEKDLEIAFTALGENYKPEDRDKLKTALENRSYTLASFIIMRPHLTILVAILLSWLALYFFF